MKTNGIMIFYTGMGKSGDQNINFAQNKTLFESNANGVSVYLFEVFISKQYIYRGKVILCYNPLQGTQKGENGIMRKVWVFPIKENNSSH